MFHWNNKKRWNSLFVPGMSFGEKNDVSSEEVGCKVLQREGLWAAFYLLHMLVFRWRLWVVSNGHPMISHTSLKVDFNWCSLDFMNMNILIFFPQSLKTCIFFTVIFPFWCSVRISASISNFKIDLYFECSDYGFELTDARNKICTRADWFDENLIKQNCKGGHTYNKTQG